MLAKLAPARAFRVKMPNQISTWLSQLAEVGVKWKVTLGCAANQASFFLWVERFVEDDMDLAIGRVLGDEFGHECLEIDALLGLGGLAASEAGGDFERREQVDRAMPFVGAFEALNNLAAAGQHIPPGPLQRLDRRLLVDAQDQRMFRRVQVEPDDIGGFGG